MSSPPRGHDSPQRAAARCLLLGGANGPERRRLAARLAREAGLTVHALGTRRGALEALKRGGYEVLLASLEEPHGGLSLLEEIRRHGLRPAVIAFTRPDAIADSVQAMRLGAWDVLPWPVDPAAVRSTIERALRERSAGGESAFRNLIGKGPAMAGALALAERVARTRATVLIEGETGTGKEQVARAIHAASELSNGPLVVVNCAALPQTLLESELFGHEKGAFTGAAEQRLGRLELAHGGTVFIDEVGDVPPPVQAKLLRVLQERRFERLGGTEPVEVDVRILASSNRPLLRLVHEGTFREDLFYRLNIIKIELPPLRDRPEDIPLLAAYFASRYALPGGEPLEFAPETLDALVEYPWPGNVRELENVVQRACVTASRSPIRRAHLPPELFEPPSEPIRFPIDLDRSLPEALGELVAEVEQYYLRRALRRSLGHVGRCAEISGLSRRSVTLKLQQYNIARTLYTEGP
ncbi:MAG: sigma-54 dependent transcriptional regulator [Gemmataceae bacterium]|nr:sigma-54 dependent transcriptional regulator [Gemmataceae bacterium]